MKTGSTVIWAIALFTLMLLLPLSNAYSATSWVKHYVSSSSGGVSPTVVQTLDGGYIATGVKYSSGSSGSDVMVFRLDPLGNILWQKTYDLTPFDQSTSIQETSDGGYIVSGGNWIMKLDNIGNIEWQKFIKTNRYNAYTTGAYQTPDNGFILVSSLRLEYDSSKGYTWIIKFDSTGNISWQKYLGIRNVAFDLKVTSDAGYLIAGSLLDANYDGYVIKLDYTGNMLWQRRFSGWAHDFATSVIEDSDGSVVVSGYTDWNYAGTAWTIKFDQNGGLMWKHQYGNTRTGTKIAALKRGGYLLGIGSGLIKLNTGGVAEWYSVFASNGSWVGSLNSTKDGGVISSWGREIRKDVLVDDVFQCGINKRPMATENLTLVVENLAAPLLIPAQTFFSDVLFAASNGDMTAQSLCMSATPEISTGVKSLDFGSVKIGTSKTATVTVTNTGSDFLNLFGANVTGPGADAFAYTTDCSTVPSGGSCSIRVAYTPKIAGTVNATMSISSNDPVHPSIEVLFSGTGEPMAEAGPDQTVEQTSPAGAYVALDGSGSKLGCAETPNYQWTWSMGSAIGVNPVALLPAGNTTVTLQVTACGTSATDAVSITIRDTVRPVTASNLIGLPGLNGWFRSDVTVALSASDAGSGIREIRYSIDGATETAVLSQNTNVTIAAEGMHTLIYYAIDNAGNIEPPTAVTLKIDKTSPDIIIEGVQHGKTYELGLTPPSPSYTASDALSGVAAGSSSNLSGGSDTGLGEYTYTVTASDNAGNTVTKIAVYYVAATPGKLDALITQMEKTSPPLITGNTGEVLIDFLKDALKKYEGGNLDAADNKMENAFIHHILAQSGKTITLDAAAVLIDAAKYIIEHN